LADQARQGITTGTELVLLILMTVNTWSYKRYRGGSKGRKYKFQSFRKKGIWHWASNKI